MRGVWDYLHDKAQAPPFLQLGLWCEHWKRPIVDGGYDDQPVRRTSMMNLALDYYNSIGGYMRASNKLKGKDWIEWTKEHGHAVEVFNKRRRWF